MLTVSLKKRTKFAGTTELNTQIQLKKIATRSSTYENDPHYSLHTVKESFFALKFSVKYSAHVSEVQRQMQCLNNYDDSFSKFLSLTV